MKKILSLVILSAVLLPATPVFAESPSAVLATCLIDNLSGKERKGLAKWIFFSIGSHPEIKSYSRAKPADIEKSDKFVGKLITRLLTVDCPEKLRTAYTSDPLAVKKAFGLVGRVAMQELMTNQEVMRTLTNYGNYADKDKINKLLGTK